MGKVKTPQPPALSDDLIDLIEDEISAMIDEDELTEAGVASIIERWQMEHDPETAHKMKLALCAIYTDVQSHR